MHYDHPSVLCRRPMWDDNGDWFESEPESAKTLNKLLCRPVRHLWMESPEARARQGQVWGSLGRL